MRFLPLLFALACTAPQIAATSTEAVATPTLSYDQLFVFCLNESPSSQLQDVLMSGADVRFLADLPDHPSYPVVESMLAAGGLHIPMVTTSMDIGTVITMLDGNDPRNEIMYTPPGAP